MRTLTPGPRGCEDSDPGAAEVEGSAYAACSASDGEPCLVSADSPYLLTAKPSQGPKTEQQTPVTKEMVAELSKPPLEEAFVKD